MIQIISLLLLFTISLQASESEEKTPPFSGNILFLMQTGNPAEALKAYRQYTKDTGNHDFELLQQVALLFLDQGYRSSDAQTQLLTIFGAGISANEKALYILERGIENENPQLQLISLNFLSRYQNDRADEMINRALSSNHLLIRLEAVYYLAQKKYRTAQGQTEALMSKIDKKLWFVFPQIFALMGDPASIRILRKLMTEQDDNVRIEAVLSAAKYGRDDLLPKIRILASQHNRGQQEACAIALGELKDNSALDKLEKLSLSPVPSVRLAAYKALYQLGKEECRLSIEEEAKKDNLFAINLLGNMPGSEDFLFKLTKSDNFQVRLNAILGLLERRDSRVLNSIAEILIKDHRDLAFIKQTTAGKGLTAWKAIPQSTENFQENPYLYELSIGMRESVLSKSLDLPEKDFLRIANTLLEVQQHDLIPLVVQLLENLGTQKAIELLKKYQQKIGAPLVRNYCNLALYRLNEPGPYGEILRNWVSQQKQTDIIQFRPFVPWELRMTDANYQLTAQETSQLLIESVEALAKAQDVASMDALIDLIENGNQNNRYALAGLLIRALQ